jgi:ribonuclease HI
MRRAPAYIPDILDDDALTIYVDGSHKPAPRRGGIGIRFVWVNDRGYEEFLDESLPATMGATINQMELEGPSAALEFADRGRLPVPLSRFRKIVIRSDSRYVCDNLNNAKFVWPKSKWLTRTGTAVQNAPDWEKLMRLLHRFERDYRLRVEFEWIPGKKGRHAIAVDKLAKRSRDSAHFERVRPTLARHKKSPRELERGSVKVSGQVFVIHVVAMRYLPKRRPTSVCTYEVMSRESPYYQAVDVAETEQPLDAGHFYEVRMNSDQANPRIEELLQEVEEDLSPFIDALRSLGEPATIAQVQTEVARSTGAPISRGAVQHRLDLLVEDGQVRRDRTATGRRPYVYDLEAATPSARDSGS